MLYESINIVMFKENKYTKIYYQLIDRAIDRTIDGYTETHHIIPKSLGGSNDITNLIVLTAREHFICHLLLTKMVEDELKHKMVYAAWQQSRPSMNKSLKITNRIYEMLRKELSKSYTGRKRAPFTEQAKANMKRGAATRKKVEYSAERLEKLAKNRKNVAGWNKGIKMELSVEDRDKMSKKFSEINKGKPKPRKLCPYCSRSISVNMYAKHHGENCKVNQPEFS